MTVFLASFLVEDVIGFRISEKVLFKVGRMAATAAAKVAEVREITRYD